MADHKNSAARPGPSPVPRVSRLGWPRRLIAGAVCVLLTAGGLLAADQLLMSPTQQGLASAEAARAEGSLERGVLASQRAFLAGQVLAAAPVVLLGPGRALDGESLSAALGSHTPVVDMTHLGMQPFELLAAADEVLALAPALVVIEFCCLDTHGPLRVGTQTAPGSVLAVHTLEQLLGPNTANRQRGLLRRLELSARSQTARWWGLRASPEPITLPTEPPGDRRTPLLVVPGAPSAMAGDEPAFAMGATADDALESTAAADVAAAADDAAEPAGPMAAVIEPDDPLSRPAQIALCREVQRGRHAEVGVALLVAAIELLAAADVPVLLVEAPLHSGTRVLFDRPIRTELLEALAPLVAHDLVALITEHQTGPFPRGDYADLLTLDADGRARLAEGLSRPVRGMLRR